MTIFSATLALLLAGAAFGLASPRALAADPSCAQTSDSSTPATASPGQPCWTDVTSYPFGSDGNPVDLSSGKCGDQSVSPLGPDWLGDFNLGATGSEAPPCYLQVTSMAFRAWNRGLAAAEQPLAGYESTNAFGVWLYNGTRWFPDPTFPGASTCPGSTVLWAGKLDYWLIGPGEGDSTATNAQTLCRFDGVNFEWEVLKLPAATLARFPIDQNNGKPIGGVTAGACYAWDNCWFFGNEGAVVHWDGQVLNDASLGPATSAWLDGNFTGAVARTDPSGNPFGFAVTGSGSEQFGGNPLPPQPDGSPPPQLFRSSDGPFAPLPFTPPSTPQPGDPYTTDLDAVDFDSSGDGWVAADPAGRESAASQPAPLIRLTERGAAAQCAGYDASSGYDAGTLNATGFGGALSLQWTTLSVFPNDGSALAGGSSRYNDPNPTNANGPEPMLVHATCGQAPEITHFRIPDPFVANAATATLVPADASSGKVMTVAANADNDAWAATIYGTLTNQSSGFVAAERPHIYHWTDGQPPDAPAGDDYEPRPSVFTIDPPVYVQPPPDVVIVKPPTTVHKPSKPKTKKLKPAVFDVRSRLQAQTLTLYIIFRLRRPVTIGVVALRGRQVVSSSGLKRFRGKSGELALKLNRRRWPTSIRFVAPKQPTKKKKTS